MAYKITSAPGADAYDLTELKDHLKVEHSDEDTLIGNLGKGAQAYIENLIGEKLITQTVEEYFDNFYRCFYLGVGPVQSITSIEYLIDDVWTNWDTSEFIEDLVSVPERIQLKPDYTAPTMDSVINRFRVTYVVGYGATHTDIPLDIKNAIYLRAAGKYAKREDYGQRYIDASIALIRNYKR